MHPRRLSAYLTRILMGFVLVASCAAPRAETQTRARGKVIFLPEGREVHVTVELANTEEEHRRGLMFRRTLEAYHGMLFTFASERVHSFWMRDTFLPLDLIFIGADHEVVGVIADAEPLSERPLRVERPSRYIVEVNAGFAREHRIAAGCKVRIAIK